MSVVSEGKFLDTNFAEFCTLPELDYSLAYAALVGLSKDTSRDFCYDYSMNKSMNRGVVLAAALELKKYFDKNFAGEKRIGIALPSGIPGLLVNLAAQMAGKSCVNLNFTLGRAAAAHCVKTAELKSVVSAQKLRKKLEEKGINFPWPEKFIDIAEVLKNMSKISVLKNLALVKTLSASALASLFGIEKFGGKREASIIFTSGSEGMPKAAVLTHRNIVGNCVQMHYCGEVFPDDVLHANLPLFHSFGQSIQLWFALMYGVKNTMVASPLEVRQNFDAMRRNKSTIMISTPTFLRAYLRKGNPEDAKSLKYVIAGAEKTPEGLCALWNARFPNSCYMEGYGLTEASPVVCVNHRKIATRNKFRDYPSDCKVGSIGPLFPGMKAGILDMDTKEFLPIGQTGMLCLKGPNIFGGYKGLPELNSEKFFDGWLITGDLASIDEDGYIFIKGRLSRFSKIGGEMVPHTTIEEAIVKAYDKQDSETLCFAVAACEDSAKGESIVLLTTIDIDKSELRAKLSALGFPNLWLPRHIVKVDAIPVLPTGKMDLKSVREIAKGAAAL